MKRYEVNKNILPPTPASHPVIYDRVCALEATMACFRLWRRRYKLLSTTVSIDQWKQRLEAVIKNNGAHINIFLNNLTNVTV